MAARCPGDSADVPPGPGPLSRHGATSARAVGIYLGSATGGSRANGSAVEWQAGFISVPIRAGSSFTVHVATQFILPFILPGLYLNISRIRRSTGRSRTHKHRLLPCFVSELMSNMDLYATPRWATRGTWGRHGSPNGRCVTSVTCGGYLGDRTMRGRDREFEV